MRTITLKAIRAIAIHAQDTIPLGISVSLEPGKEIAAVRFAKHFFTMCSPTASNMVDAEKFHMLFSATLTFKTTIGFKDFEFELLMGDFVLSSPLFSMNIFI